MQATAEVYLFRRNIGIGIVVNKIYIGDYRDSLGVFRDTIQESTLS